MSRVRQSHRKGTWLWSTHRGTIQVTAELDLRLGARLVGPNRLTSRPLPTIIRDLVIQRQHGLDSSRQTPRLTFTPLSQHTGAQVLVAAAATMPVTANSAMKTEVK